MDFTVLILLTTVGNHILQIRWLLNILF